MHKKSHKTDTGHIDEKHDAPGDSVSADRMGQVDLVGLFPPKVYPVSGSISTLIFGLTTSRVSYMYQCMRPKKLLS